MNTEKFVNILEKIEAVGAIPTLKNSDSECVIKITDCMFKSGMDSVVLLYDEEKTAELIKAVKKQNANMTVGVLVPNCEKAAESCMEAGADFLTTVGVNASVIKFVIDSGNVIIPGCLSASEVETVKDLGLSAVNLCPVKYNGESGYAKFLASNYPSVKFIVSGEVECKDLGNYLTPRNVIAGFIGDIFEGSCESDEIDKICADTIRTLLGIELRHIGINNPDEQAAREVVKRLEDVFGIPRSKEGKGAIFVGTYAEVLKKIYLGQKGHLAMATNSIYAAMHYLNNSGVKLNEDSKAYNPEGRLIAVYLEEEIGGYAYHLLQKQ